MTFTDTTTKTGLLGTASRFCRDTRGSLALWTSIMALPLALSVGVAMDIQRAGRDHSTLKATLDAAVLAAVNNNAISDAERRSFAEQAFRDAHTGAPIVRLESFVEGGAVSLAATLRTDLTLSSMVGMSELEVSARSTAQLNTPDIICALALNETAAGAITFGDAVSFDANTCSVQSNSNHADAIVSLAMQGPVASNFCAHGGTTGSFKPGGTGECARIADPYENMKLPRAPRCERLDRDEDVVDLSQALRSDAARRPENGESVPALDIRDADFLDQVADFGGDPLIDVGGGPTLPIDRIGEVEQVLRDLMGDESEHIEMIHWKTDDGDRKIHVHFGLDDVNPLGSDDELSIYEHQVDAFLEEYGGVPMPAELLEDFDPTFPVARVTLGDGRTVVMDNDDSHTLVDTGAVLTPGNYCGGLTVAGADVTLKPGTYHMTDGPFVVKDTASVVGDGVTIILGGRNAHLKVESEGRLSLKAPKQGSLEGLVVVEDTSEKNSSFFASTSAFDNDDDDGEAERLTSRITSGGELIVTGTVYLPTHAVEVTGDDSGLGSHAPSTSFIADTLLFDGTGQVRISVDHEAAGLPPVQPRSEDGARLVE